MTPAEIIDRRRKGLINTRTMMAQLSGYEYTYGYAPVVGGHYVDAYVRGSWDDVERGYRRGWLSDVEFGVLLDLNGAGLRAAATGETA